MNYKKNRIFVFVLSLCLTSNSFAQIKPLSVGDTLPDIQLQNIINYSQKNGSTQSFRGKLLILDFWATWCSPCVAMFPKTDSLQRNFSDMVQFLPVSYQKKEEVKPFLMNMQKATGLKVPSVVEDTLLGLLFPHTTVPHYVWITKDGIIKAITGMEAINTNNINTVLAGNSLNIAIKSEADERKVNQFDQFFRESFNFADKAGNTGNSYINNNPKYYHSVFSGQIDNIQGFISFDLENRLTAINVSPLLLLRDFYGLQKKYNREMNAFFSPGKTQFEVSDTTIIYAMSGGYLNKFDPLSWRDNNPWINWSKKYAICYEFMAPKNCTENRRNSMIEKDLLRYFADIYHVNFQIEKRSIHALALRKLPRFTSIISKSSETEAVKSVTPYSITLKHKAYGDFLTGLTDYYRDRFAIDDETGIGIHQLIDIQLDCKISDYHALNKELSRYGLELAPKDILTDVLVIHQIDDEEKPLKITKTVYAL